MVMAAVEQTTFDLLDIFYQINVKLLKFSSIYHSGLEFIETFNDIDRIDLLWILIASQLLYFDDEYA